MTKPEQRPLRVVIQREACLWWSVHLHADSWMCLRMFDPTCHSAAEDFARRLAHFLGVRWEELP